MAETKAMIDIRSGRLFPFPFLVIGAACCFASLVLLSTSALLAAPLFLLGAAIITAYEGTEIYPGSRYYREYQSFLFLKKGKRRKYESLEKIFINLAKVSQRIHTAHTMKSATFTNVEYNAYLKFGDGTKIFLCSDKSKSRLLQKLSGTGRDLEIPVVDNSAANGPRVVNG